MPRKRAPKVPKLTIPLTVQMRADLIRYQLVVSTERGHPVPLQTLGVEAIRAMLARHKTAGPTGADPVSREGGRP